MMPELEHLIQKRAHEIWEQEGRPHGRHEEHWRMAAEEVTREVERLKAEHRDDGGTAAPKGRGGRAKATEDAPAPRARRSKAAGDGTAGPETKPARRRASKATEGGGAQAEPVAAPKATRRRSTKAEGASS